MKICCHDTGSDAKKGYDKRRHAQCLSHSGDQLSTQELALAKPLKQSKKFVSHSLGLSTTKKTSSATVKIHGGKMSSTFAGRSGAAQALTRALDLFDSGSSASDGETVNLVPPRKHPRKSLIPKSAPKPSEAHAVKGTLEQFLALRLSESYDIEHFPVFVIVKTAVALVTAGVNDSGSGGVRADE
jgi:hypothetical protein